MKPSVGEFGDAVIPFNNFTDAWNDGTGDPVKRCLTPGAPCPDGTCSDGKTCCPLTKLCVDVGGDCVPDTPCASDEYCCPDVSLCVKPTSPGVPCPDPFNTCPLTHLCVTP